MNRSLGPRYRGSFAAGVVVLLTFVGVGSAPVSIAGAAGTAIFPETPAPLQITRNLTMQQAARAGILKLTPKGGFEGDDVRAELEGKQVKAPINVTLHVEYEWAEGHSAKENEIVRNDLPRLERATEKELNKRHYQTSKGEPISFDLDFKWREPGQPPTPGYDEVTVINPLKDLPKPEPGRRPSVEDLGVANSDKVIGGTFPLGSLNSQELAHESLHMVGLDDKYSDYYVYQGREIPLPETAMTQSALAAYLKTVKPPITNPSTKYVKEKDLPGSSPCDVMGGGEFKSCAKISQKDLDLIGSQAGVQIEAKPGELLLNKSSTLQNLAVGYPTKIIAPRGGTTVAPGISAYCVDHTKGPPGIGGADFTPSPSEGFDVGPELASLPGFTPVKKLLDLNAELQPSLADPVKGMEDAIWNVTDGVPIEEENEPADVTAAAKSLLARAGVPENSTPGGLPHLGNPNGGAATTGAVDASGAIMPPLPAEAVEPVPPVTLDTVALIPAKVDSGQAAHPFLLLGIVGESSGVKLELQRRKGKKWKSVKSLPGRSVDSGQVELPLNLGRLGAGEYRVQVTVSEPSGPSIVRTAALTVAAAHHSGKKMSRG